MCLYTFSLLSLHIYNVIHVYIDGRSAAAGTLLLLLSFYFFFLSFLFAVVFSVWCAMLYKIQPALYIVIYGWPVRLLTYSMRLAMYCMPSNPIVFQYCIQRVTIRSAVAYVNGR